MKSLIEVIMQFWGKVPKAWKNRILNKTNRAYKAITGYPADESDIDIAVKTTVWIWDDDPDSFISWRSSPQQGTAPLDFFISLVNTLLRSGLISASFHSQICGKWPQMVRGGGKYNSISNDLGGYGAMVYIPDVGHTTYEVHLPSTGTIFSATIEELRKKNVPKKAERKWTVPDTEYRTTTAAARGEEGVSISKEKRREKRRHFKETDEGREKKNLRRMNSAL
ncbi:hypothetical protein I7I51_02648 [Histoplasma capsulatum]|uniref:Uncharacterized protein n=1 Tax=Ajellomyces capsulatus TaxID=5037 RepID=A0A8A1MAT0_AJECA|nr:predicted protein [Histoplasma mississippiense (nom. inval.)]EDN04293.1 predicted protein [Histoplasma mississippiense (nom. inval.)]QSS62905.1 hypothetical protein I7I51_02648 [Histoplasma capsulatum]